MRRVGQVTAFYTYRDFMSNHFLCTFTIHGVTFNCTEQFLMYCKAKLLGDHATAALILAEKHPQAQKMLGRRVTPYNDSAWFPKRYRYYVKGCLAKYEQNPILEQLLLATGDTTLAEASERDRDWGIGLAEDHPDVEFPHKWPGLNLCGSGNQEARDILKKGGTAWLNKTRSVT